MTNHKIDQEAEQLILNLASEPSFEADEYILLPSNQPYIDQLLDQEQISAPLATPLTLLFGAKKSGKTHLAHLWQQAHAAVFMPDAYLKVAEDDFPTLAKFVGNNAVIIDDIDTKLSCEKSIFHIINLAIQFDQKILITASKPLMQWGIKLPDLLSRLKAAKHIEITPPDDLLMEALLIKSFAEKQLNVADNVIAYILPRIDRSALAVIELVETLDIYALKSKKPITRMMVGKILEDTV
ncbi:MAG: hypothetical protein HRU29_01145 [Rhizobiales bacterium]|nr:DnaA/Hda family protein [Hyphomicrobiales bacterium]NRB12978.1 hypothetical protein [Hyphomicrobiales bacterium]